MWNSNLSPQIDKLAVGIFNLYEIYISKINVDQKYKTYDDEDIDSFWGNDIFWSDESIINYIIDCSTKDGWLEKYIDKLSEEDKIVLFSYAFGEK